MTLEELKNKCYARPSISLPATIYVFDDEESADCWILDKYMGEKNGDYELVTVLQSDYKMRYSFKEEWCKAEVKHFFAVEPDVLVAVVKKWEGEE